MAPSPIPAPLPPWARALLQLAPLIPSGLQQVLEYIGTMDSADSPTPDAWMHVHLVGQPVTSTEVADNFVTTFDIVNITGGAIDSTWNEADFAAVSAQIYALSQGWVSRMSSDYRWIEQRYYRRYFNPLSLTQPFAPSGPPAMIIPNSGTGAQGSYQAPQVAVTTTDRTAYPGHWGRNYWPHPYAGLASSGGYISQSSVDSLAQLVHDVYEDLMGAEFYPVVPITRYTSGDTVIPARGLLTISEVQVDNLFDVMRSRRPKKATYRKRLPL